MGKQLFPKWIPLFANIDVQSVLEYYYYTHKELTNLKVVVCNNLIGRMLKQPGLNPRAYILY